MLDIGSTDAHVALLYLVSTKLMINSKFKLIKHGKVALFFKTVNLISLFCLLFVRWTE